MKRREGGRETEKEREGGKWLWNEVRNNGLRGVFIGGKGKGV